MPSYHKSCLLLLSFVAIIISGCKKSDPMLIELISHPQSKTVCQGAQVELHVSAQCSGQLHYQWEQSNESTWTQVGTDQPTYHTAPLENTTRYRAYVFSNSDACFPVYSETSVIEIIDSISIVYHPSGARLVEGASRILYVLPQGSMTFHYQWEAFDGNQWQVTGENKDQYQVADLEQSMTYRVQVSSLENGCGPVYSNEAFIQVSSIEKIIGNYIGICHEESSTINQQNGQIIITYDTINAETTVSLIQENDDYYAIDISTLYLFSPFIVTNEHLFLDTISLFSHWSTRSVTVNWIPEVNQMTTDYFDGGISQFYLKNKCYYQKME